MSRAGKRIIRRFPDHSKIHDPDNLMHQLLDYGVGKWFDNFEDMMYKHIEKRNIITNVSEDEDEGSEDYKLSSDFLDIQGKEYGILRKANEKNNEYRARILAQTQNNLTISSIRRITASILSVSEDQITVTNNRKHFCIGDMVCGRLSGKGSNPVLSLKEKVRGLVFIRVPETSVDLDFLKEELEKAVLAGVEVILLYTKILISPDISDYAEEGGDFDFTVQLLDQDNQPIADKQIYFYKNDTLLGLTTTNENGEATYTLNNVEKGVYSLKAKYNNIFSEPHNLVVKKGIKLELEGTDYITDDETYIYTVTATNKETLVQGLNVSFYENNTVIGIGVTDEEGKASINYNATRNGTFKVFAKSENNEDYFQAISNSISLTVYNEDWVTPPFIHYDLAGLENVEVVKQSTTPVLIDITQSGGYYRSVSHQKQETGYAQQTPPNSGVNWSGSVGLAANDMLNIPLNNLPTVATYVDKVSVSVYGVASAGNKTSIGIYSPLVGLGDISGEMSYSYKNISASPQNLSSTQIGGIRLQGASVNGSLAAMRVDATVTWKPVSVPYPYYSYYTNANFKSGKMIITSNTAELVIENNQRAITSLKGFIASNNFAKETLITNQNVKYATITGWDNEEYLFELAYNISGSSSAVNYNLFSDLFLKNIHNIDLIDISYELEMIVKHDLTTQEVNTLIAADNNNRNIYRHKIIVNDFPLNDKEVEKTVREDKKNIRFVLKEEKVLLNHYVDSQSNFIIEMPNKYLKADEITINAVILPKTYEYENKELSDLTELQFNEIDYMLL